MREVPFEDVKGAIAVALAEPGERVVLATPVDVQVFDSHASEFLSTFATMVEMHHAPDFPGSVNVRDELARLGLLGTMAAWWDFDYYALSLSLIEHRIVLCCHV